MSHPCYYQCPRCHTHTSDRGELITHLKKIQSCSNDYDNTARNILVEELWRTPERFQIDQVIVLKAEIERLKAVIADLRAET
jgi:hypothetical protein